MCLINILIAIVLLIGGIFCDTDIVTDWSISAVQNYHLVYSMIRYDKTVLIWPQKLTINKRSLPHGAKLKLTNEKKTNKNERENSEKQSMSC